MKMKEELASEGFGGKIKAFAQKVSAGHAASAYNAEAPVAPAAAPPASNRRLPFPQP